MSTHHFWFSDKQSARIMQLMTDVSSTAARMVEWIRSYAQSLTFVTGVTSCPADTPYHNC